MQIQSLPSTPPRRDPLRIQRAVLLALRGSRIAVACGGALAEPAVVGVRTARPCHADPRGHRLAQHRRNDQCRASGISRDGGYFRSSCFATSRESFPVRISANRSLFAYRQVMPGSTHWPRALSSRSACMPWSMSSRSSCSAGWDTRACPRRQSNLWRSPSC